VTLVTVMMPCPHGLGDEAPPSILPGFGGCASAETSRKTPLESTRARRRSARRAHGRGSSLWHGRSAPNRKETTATERSPDRQRLYGPQFSPKSSVEI
jgi:hypothetical protein